MADFFYAQSAEKACNLPRTKRTSKGPWRTKAGTSFNSGCRLYDFDKKLRTVIFGAIEEIEGFLRCRLSYHFPHQDGPLGYREEANFSKRHSHEKVTRRLDKEIAQNAELLFAGHHMEHYDSACRFPTRPSGAGATHP